jgi:hypothetical protein
MYRWHYWFLFFLSGHLYGQDFTALMSVKDSKADYYSNNVPERELPAIIAEAKVWKKRTLQLQVINRYLIKPFQLGG